MSVDVAIVVTGHSEGFLAGRTLRAAQASARVATEAGISVHLLGVLDRATEETCEVFRRYCDSILEVNNGDLGRSRNAAVQATDAKFVCFCDADDLFGLTWVRDAYLQAVKSGPAVFHPQFCVFFGDVSQTYMREHISSTSPAFNHDVLTQYNVWSALAFARREVFLETPYVAVEHGCGYEDWQFNLDTLAQGIPHIAVDATLHWIRIKASASLCRDLAAANTALAPTKWYLAPRGSGAAQKMGSVYNPQWLRKEALAANAIDPQCWVEHPRFEATTEARAADSIWSCMHAPRGAAVIVTPVLGIGGVPKAVRNAVAYYVACRQPVVVIVTDGPAEPIEGATVLAPFIGRSLRAEEQGFALQTILVQLQPTAIHAANSGIAMGVIRLNPACLRRTAKLHVWSFGEEVSSAGRRVSPAFWYLGHIWPHLTAVITDSKYWADELARLFDLPQSLFKVCRQPVAIGANPDYNSQPLTVLWAGRLEPEKGIDFLAEVVAQTHAQGLGVRFVVAGSGSLEPEIRKLPVEYWGAYTDFSELPPAQVFLMTSPREGAAQVLLEAQARGMVPVVPAVGGLPEICYGGFVVPRVVADFVATLANIASDSFDLERMGKAGQRSVATNHSKGAFSFDFSSAGA